MLLICDRMTQNLFLLKYSLEALHFIESSGIPRIPALAES
jgi:hypothetical protein